MAEAHDRIIRVPLTVKFNCRSADLTQDSLAVNVFNETDGQQAVAVKRPGLYGKYTYDVPMTNTAAASPITYTTTKGQGLIQIGKWLYALANDNIIGLTVPGGITPIPLPMHNSGGDVDLPQQRFFILQGSAAPVSGAGGSGTGALLVSRYGLYVAAPAGTGIPTVTWTGPAQSFLSPDRYTPGAVELDGTYYVMSWDGTIYGSALQDPLTWPALAFVQGDTSFGLGRGLYRHLNYVAAWQEKCLTLYYDAGTATGIKLLPVSNGSYNVGCATWQSIVTLENNTYFMGQSGTAGRTIQVLSGLQLVPVSTPEVERVLNDDDLVEVYAQGIRVAGHSFYVLSLVDSAITLVYDATRNEWNIWTQATNPAGGNEIIMQLVSQVSFGGQDLFCNLNGGIAYGISPSQGTDDGAAINCRIRTDTFNWGNQRTKFIAATYLLADTVPATAQLRYSNDDYQTWSAYQTVALSNSKKQLIRCGSTVERAWELWYTGGYPMRFYELEVEVSLGSL